VTSAGGCGRNPICVRTMKLLKVAPHFSFAVAAGARRFGVEYRLVQRGSRWPLAMPMSAGRSSAARSANWNRCGAVQAMIERSRGEKDFEHQYRSMSDGSGISDSSLKTPQDWPA
jgi:hypothetical protein